MSRSEAISGNGYDAEDVDREKTFQHPGEEFIFVVAGETEYRVSRALRQRARSTSLLCPGSSRTPTPEPMLPPT